MTTMTPEEMLAYARKLIDETGELLAQQDDLLEQARVIRERMSLNMRSAMYLVDDIEGKHPK